MKNIIKKTVTTVAIIAMALTLAMPMTAEAKAKPKLNKTKLTLTITKKKTKPTYKLKVKNASGKVKWKTSNKRVATVSKSGKITAKNKGTAVISAKAGKRTLRCKVTVKDTRKNNTPKKPEPTPVPQCDHVYEDHWTEIKEIYAFDKDIVHYPDICWCGAFPASDKEAFKGHVFEAFAKRGGVFREPWEVCMGIHSETAKTASGVVGNIDGEMIINDKIYEFLWTKYIDKRTCTKCGIVRTTWDIKRGRPGTTLVTPIPASEVPEGLMILNPETLEWEVLDPNTLTIPDPESFNWGEPVELEPIEGTDWD